MLTNRIFKPPLTALFFALLLSVVFSTANAQKDSKGPQNRKPPAEAFTACADLAEEDACSFSTPDDETIEGSCKVPRNDEESLVCQPSHGKHKGKGRME